MALLQISLAPILSGALGLLSVNLSQGNRILDKVRALVAAWPHYFRKYGVGEDDIERLGGVIAAID